VSAPRDQHRGVVLAIILTGYLLVLIDVSILMVALPRIHHDLRFSAAGLSWAQNAYTLTFGGLLLLGARVGDLIGRRRAFTAGIALFAASSLAVALAQSPTAMIIARATQGIGAATLAPSLPRPSRCCRPASPKDTSAPARWPPTVRWPASRRASA